jgi:pyruvate,orthophosphate dikinase
VKKYVYSFKEGKVHMKDLLGGKGANLAEMTNIGLPVPQGFTITTEACNEYYEKNRQLWPELIDEIHTQLKTLEEVTGKTFGGGSNPLLVSVRSGAKFSMPGMMDTILNLGLNDKTVKTMVDATNNRRFVLDSYRRFIQMFSDVVMEIPKSKFERILDEIKEHKGVKFDTDLTADDLQEVVDKFKALYKEVLGEDFPQDSDAQLLHAVTAVFRSWNNERAILYRQLNNISGSLGTAVNIQSMVFGNMGDDCGTGVAFTRDPATGEAKMLGEFLMNAQGEDVVAGIRTPLSIDKLMEINKEVYDQFMEASTLLENHYRDMQDIEFTIEKGKLFMLQTRNGKRTAAAALRIAVELVEQGLITKDEAIMRVEPAQLDQLLHPTFDVTALKNATVIANGLPASPGAASGKVYFTAEAAVHAVRTNGEKVILVRLETSPEDLEGMVEAQGILTARGGRTSHAAVVARGMGKCCVAGCEALKVKEEEKKFYIGDKTYHEGDFISLDGSTGNVYEGVIETKTPELSGHFGTLMAWADEVRKLKVRTNADTPKDAEQAVKFGAEGIGLCRTEHMFFEEDRIAAMREMIVAEQVEARKLALEKLLPYQKADFIGIFEAMGARPVTIRLLDPPLHEFLPHSDEDIADLAKTMGITFEKLKASVESLHEFNPMLGHRGCRLAVTYPEIAEMQTRAIIEAAIDVKKNKGIDVHPEIMIPLVGDVKELEYLENICRKLADNLIKESGIVLEYMFGTMIEVPRGAVTADEIAKTAEFFSFGTNDLTQMTYGFSRDDAGKFIKDYLEKGVFEQDPFMTLDQVGVGKLVKMAAELGRSTRPEIKLGICGEHGGDPASIEFCHNVGLNYVSCSPFRVPIARLAAAQATLKEKMGSGYSQK